jgi:hypothetical protein
MLNTCANPQCAKPLHYLREGRVFVFDAIVKSSVDASKKDHRLEHFWLCGDCSETLMLEQTMSGVRVVHRSGLRSKRTPVLTPEVLAAS